MANPYEQAAHIAAPYSGLGTQILAGANAYERGKTHMQSEMAKQFAMQQHGDMYGAQAGKMRAETDTINQRRQYQTPEFASQIAATMNGFAPEVGQQIASGHIPEGITPEQVQSFNRGRGAHLANLGATGNSSVDQVVKAFTGLLGQGRTDQAIANPSQAPNIAQGVAAGNGEALFDKIGTNQYTGVQNLTPYGKSEVGKNNAQSANSYASADQHKASAASTRAKMGQPTVNPDGSVTGPLPPPKPMPPQALKMQQEGLENLSIASNINPMLQRFAEDIDSKKLTLGPVANLVNKGKNFAGSSDEGSRNFASFQATLEKLRNDSLRLNKGVQTDGDAQRAWNELMSNINDPGVVKQRIQEIQGINEKAVELHRMNINQVRRNYGNSDIDVSGYVAKPTSTTSKETKPQYTRTGMFNGRKVGMLPNGQTVYQDTGEVAK